MNHPIDHIPAHHTTFLDLPLCRLHLLHAGSGPPMIMVPATISRYQNWLELIRFAAQWFEVYFFELPGHGESSAFNQPFSTALVGELVVQLADHIGLSRFNLMGFSFGGILAMQAFLRLHQRIDRLVLIAPCLTHRAIQLSPARRKLVRALVGLLNRPTFRENFYHLLHQPPYSRLSAAALRRLGNVEETIPIEDVLRNLSRTTLEVVSAQIQETLQIEFPIPQERYSNPCYFAMSLYDPLLDYQITLQTLQRFIAAPSVTELTYPFHQPPRPFTLDELNAGFRATVESFIRSPWVGVLPTPL